MTRRSRVLVVDDSTTVRAVLRRVLSADGDIEVVGESARGDHAVAAAAELEPDAIVMDLDLPGMDGLTASREILRRRNTPIVVVTSADGAHRQRVAAAFKSIASSVVTVFGKPQVPEDWQPLGVILRETVRGLGQTGARAGRTAAGPDASRDIARRPVEIIAVAASTGGPVALREMLLAFQRRCPAPIVIVQHIADGFECGLAEWLAAESGLEVEVAREGERLDGGMVRLAPAGSHLRVAVGRVLRLDGAEPPVKSHRPSATVLFRSLDWMTAHRVAGVILTGMGDDGVAGLAELRQRGALTFAQSEATCTLYGMPRAAFERGAAEHVLAPAEIARAISRASAGGDR